MYRDAGYVPLWDSCYKRYQRMVEEIAEIKAHLDPAIFVPI